MNILLTSVGRRSYLVKYFQQALCGQGNVVCANMFPHSPGMYVADTAVVTPPSWNKDYVPTIIDICKKFKINLLFSLHDLDVFVLSKHIKRLKEIGVFPVLPSEEWGRISLDKYECTRTLQSFGFHVPWTSINLEKTEVLINEKKIFFPLIVKSRMGFGSQGFKICYSVNELKLAYEDALQNIKSSGVGDFIRIPDGEGVLIQQGIFGKEYCIDIVNDLSGRYACSLMVEIHSMRAGESDMATTVDPVLAGDLPVKFSQMTSHVGAWGIDCLEDQGVFRIIDINPRFTGDYPFHQLAGANIPAALLAWSQGLDADAMWLEEEFGVRGYKDLVPTRSATFEV